jgi:hypothetical protein
MSIIFDPLDEFFVIILKEQISIQFHEEPFEDIPLVLFHYASP